MRGIGVLGAGLLVAVPLRADEPLATPAQEIYARLSTGVNAAAVGPSTSLRVSATPDGEALAVAAMATLGANLAPNPLAACWVQFPVTLPTPRAKPGLPPVTLAVALAAGPLTVSGVGPAAAAESPAPVAGLYRGYPLRAAFRVGSGGVPIVGGPNATGPDASPGFDRTRGDDNDAPLTTPPGGWTALALEPLPDDLPVTPDPADPIRETAAPPAVKAPVATPEPATLALAGLGLAAVGVRRVRRGL